LHLYLNFNRNFNITALNCYFIDKWKEVLLWLKL
jgi:hypothetical protein